MSAVPQGAEEEPLEIDVLNEALDLLDVLCEAARIGTVTPPDHVFRFFQRLHGLVETGAPPPKMTPREALDRVRVRCDQQEPGWTRYVCANGHRFTSESEPRFCAGCGTSTFSLVEAEGGE